MKTCISLFAIALTVLAVAGAETTPNAEPVKTDVLKEMREMNSAAFAAPTTRYRQGHVSPRKLDAKAISRHKDGFVIDLPGNHPIPTSSVYDGKLLVSGGFGSKQVYCFEADTGKFLWGADLDDDGPSASVVEDGIAVFNTESCTIFALEMATGKMLWSWWLGDPLVSAPAIADGRVFTTYPANGQSGQGAQLLQINGVSHQVNGAVQQATPVAAPVPVREEDKQGWQKARPPASHIMGCFDLKTGKILWQKWIDGEAISAPVVNEGEVLITTFPGTVFKFDAKSGGILAATRARATAAPTVVEGKILFPKRADSGSEVREAIAVSDSGLAMERSYNDRRADYLNAKIQSGSALASKAASWDAGNGFGSAPAASGFMAAASNVGQARVSTMQGFQGSRILHYNGYNYSCMGNEFICMEMTTGKVSWSMKLAGDMKKIGGFLGAPPVLVGDRLVLASYDGRILQVDPDKGTTIKEHKIDGNIRFQPIVMDGRIYVGTQQGKLVCLDTKDRSLTGWPMWGGNARHTGSPQAGPGKAAPSER